METANTPPGLLHLAASLATPVAAWVGGALALVARFDAAGLALRLFWHSLLCGYIAVGSALLSLALFPVARRLSRRVRVSHRVFSVLGVVLLVLVPCSLLAFLGRTSPDQPGAAAGLVFFFSGLVLNTLVFFWLDDGDSGPQGA